MPLLLSTVQIIIIITTSYYIRSCNCQSLFLTVTLDGSILTAGPIVVVTFTDFMYVPFELLVLLFELFQRQLRSFLQVFIVE